MAFYPLSGLLELGVETKPGQLGIPAKRQSRCLLAGHILLPIGGGRVSVAYAT